MFSAFRLVRDPVIILDRQSRVMAMNPAAQIFFGAPDYMEGEPWPKIILPLLEKGSTPLDDPGALLQGLSERQGAVFLVMRGERRNIRYRIARTLEDIPPPAEYMISLEDMTPALRAGREKELSENRLGKILENSQSGVIVLDLDETAQGGILRVAAWNGAAERILGVTAAQAVGRDIESISPQPFDRWILSMFRKTAARGGEAERLEDVKAQRASGEEAILSMRVHSIGPGSAAAQFLEMTGWKRVVKERDWLATAIEHAGEAIVITDAQGVIQYVNPAFEKVTGYSRAEAAGNTPRILKSGAHGPDFYKRMWADLAAGKTWRGDLVNRRKDGTLYHDHASISPVRNERGEIVNFVGVKRNITDRKLAEEALKASEQRISAIINTVGEGIIVIGADSRIRLVNREILEIFGYAQSEIMGRHVCDLMPEKYRERHDAGMRRYLEGGPAKIIGVRVELEGLRKNGDVFPLELRIQETKVEASGDRFFTAAIRDITERKRLERELREKAKSLREMGAFKDRMLSIISHDLRSPLTSIIGLMNLLLKPAAESLTERQRKIIEAMENSAHHQLKLVENLTEISRIRRRKLKLRPEHVRVAEIFEASRTILSQMAREKGIRIIDETDPGLWVEVDREKMVEVINNLISNSVKFTRGGGTVTLSAEADGDEVTMVVTDTGVGIEADRMKKIFDFTESATTLGTDGERGTGLGLSICQEITLLSGGEFSMDSKLGEGTAVRLKFRKKK